jgi:hypothetical protein
MGGAEEGIKTTMEVDFIVAEVATKNTQVVPDTIKAAIETMHPSALCTIVEIKEGIKNLQSRDGTRVT